MFSQTNFCFTFYLKKLALCQKTASFFPFFRRYFTYKTVAFSAMGVI